MIIHTDFEQNSLEWLTARAGVVTASEFSNLVTPNWNIRTGDVVNSYLARKLAERWMGGPLPGHMTLDMEFGKMREEEALPWYELNFDTPVQRVALITDDAREVGCSPDGLIAGNVGLEVKCPLAQTHVRYLLDGTVPEIYRPQVHGGMFVTGFDSWRFLSYHPRFPKLVITVERNDEAQETIARAVELFSMRLKLGWERLCDLNGGEPKRPAPIARPTPGQTDDLIP